MSRVSDSVGGINVFGSFDEKFFDFYGVTIIFQINKIILLSKKMWKLIVFTAFYWLNKRKRSFSTITMFLKQSSRCTIFYK